MCGRQDLFQVYWAFRNGYATIWPQYNRFCMLMEHSSSRRLHSKNWKNAVE